MKRFRVRMLGIGLAAMAGSALAADGDWQPSGGGSALKGRPGEAPGPMWVAPVGRFAAPGAPPAALPDLGPAQSVNGPPQLPGRVAPPALPTSGPRVGVVPQAPGESLPAA